jgi:hypothetical protein
MQSNLAMWSLVVGFFVPIVTAVVIRQAWAPGLKAIANFVIAAVAALGVVYFKGDLDTSNKNAIVSSILLVLVTSIASYHGLLRPTLVAPSIEKATG